MSKFSIKIFKFLLPSMLLNNLYAPVEITAECARVSHYDRKILISIWNASEMLDQVFNKMPADYRLVLQELKQSHVEKLFVDYIYEPERIIFKKSLGIFVDDLLLDPDFKRGIRFVHVYWGVVPVEPPRILPNRGLPALPPEVGLEVEPQVHVVPAPERIPRRALVVAQAPQGVGANAFIDVDLFIRIKEAIKQSLIYNEHELLRDLTRLPELPRIVVYIEYLYKGKPKQDKLALQECDELADFDWYIIGTEKRGESRRRDQNYIQNLALQPDYRAAPAQRMHIVVNEKFVDEGM